MSGKARPGLPLIRWASAYRHPLFPTTTKHVLPWCKSIPAVSHKLILDGSTARLRASTHHPHQRVIPVPSQRRLATQRQAIRPRATKPRTTNRATSPRRRSTPTPSTSPSHHIRTYNNDVQVVGMVPRCRRRSIGRDHHRRASYVVHCPLVPALSDRW